MKRWPRRGCEMRGSDEPPLLTARWLKRAAGAMADLMA